MSRPIKNPYSIDLHGELTIETGGVVVHLGRNLITDSFRVFVAGLLARPSVVGVTYTDDVGFDTTSPLFPASLHIGVGTTPAQVDDTSLETPLTLFGSGAAVVFDLESIRFIDDTAGYSNGINCGFQFVIPDGLAFADPVTGASTAEVTTQEWGLVASDGTLLARKVDPFIKKGALSSTFTRGIYT